MNLNHKKTIGEKCIEKYPDRIPVIVHYDKNESIGKFLVPSDKSLGHLLITIRRSSRIAYTDNLFVFIDNKLVPTSDLISLLYTKYKDKSDNCLHITVKKDNTFGYMSFIN